MYLAANYNASLETPYLTLSNPAMHCERSEMCYLNLTLISLTRVLPEVDPSDCSIVHDVHSACFWARRWLQT